MNTTPHLRPNLHFTAQRNWLNDPNGLFFYQGRFHLCYQHNPTGNEWGNIHWGHAISDDLMHWQHLPLALYPEPDGAGWVFSGGAVIDWQNTSELASSSALVTEELPPPIIATFTHQDQKAIQRQSLAFSLDGGMNWQQYPGNPVIDNPGVADFRDPKVVWYAPDKCWIMALAVGYSIQFYRSPNLRDWQLLSAFGGKAHASATQPQTFAGAQGGVWECPDLFPMQCNGESYWILIVSVQQGAPNGGSGTQYFIGDFDGQHFTPFNNQTLWLDYGPDNYASITWDGLQPEQPAHQQQRIMIGWMSNHLYARDTPTFPWRCAMTIPRQLSLVGTTKGLRLRNYPVQQLWSHNRWQTVLSYQAHTHAPPLLPVTCSDSASVLLQLTVSSKAMSHKVMFSNPDGQRLWLHVDHKQQQVVINRREVGIDMTAFPSEITAPVPEHPEDALTLLILLDRSSIEVFIADGLSSLTASCFPSSGFNTVAFAGACQHVELWQLEAD